MKSAQLIGALVAIFGAIFMAAGEYVGGARGVAVGFALFAAARVTAWLMED